ncbi:response regulator transcription factor [Bacillaceae bacterium C204]|uniref:response regulator transcription factor n=1 Tax=Neobacillus sp. 204 TaxID=3383351 RepID=UPI00397A996A
MNIVLVVDDEAEIRDVIHIYLRNEGFQVLEAEDGVQALEIVNSTSIQLIILDVMMPNLDGIKTCMKIRETSMVPIIMLSAKGEDIDKITGLTTGADDYLTKPFNPLELIARVKAQLRRQHFTPRETDRSVFTLHDLVFDKHKHFVSVSGKEVSLTPREFSILELLTDYPGQVFSADKIYETIWDEPSGYSENTVMVHIRNLRDKIEENPREPRYIKTVWGVGYKIDK